MAEGLLDTNVFVHSLARDAPSEECRRFLRAVQSGQVQAYLDPLVVHETTYALQRIVRMSRADIADYLIDVLNWPGIVADRTILLDTLGRWRDSVGLAFVDAYLAARSVRDGSPIYTKNVRELIDQGATVPNPLPGQAQPQH